MRLILHEKAVLSFQFPKKSRWKWGEKSTDHFDPNYKNIRLILANWLRFSESSKLPQFTKWSSCFSIQKYQKFKTINKNRVLFKRRKYFLFCVADILVTKMRFVRKILQRWKFHWSWFMGYTYKPTALVNWCYFWDKICSWIHREW